MKTIIYNFNKPQPLFLNNIQYQGDAVFINGYNGYSSTEGDSLLCALIDNSCFDSDNEPYYLKDEDGNYIKDIQYRGVRINVK